MFSLYSRRSQSNLSGASGGQLGDWNQDDRVSGCPPDKSLTNGTDISERCWHLNIGGFVPLESSQLIYLFIEFSAYCSHSFSFPTLIPCSSFSIFLSLSFLFTHNSVYISTGLVTHNTHSCFSLRKLNYHQNICSAPSCFFFISSLCVFFLSVTTWWCAASLSVNLENIPQTIYWVTFFVIGSQMSPGCNDVSGKELQPRRQRRTHIPDKPNYSLNLWSIMKNCIGKELSKIPMPVSVRAETLCLADRLP